MNASAYSVNRLRVALNSCIRFVFNIPRFGRVTHFQKSLIGCHFEDFFKYRSCCQIFKILVTGNPAYLSSKLNTCRNSRTRSLLVPSNQSSYYSQSLFVRGIVNWNSLPINIKTSVNLSNFKRNLLLELSRMP